MDFDFCRTNRKGNEMLRREIKFEDFDGNQVSEIHYFNLSKPEIIKLEAKYEGGFGNFLERVLESRNNGELVSQFDEIILMSYGEKTDEKHFEKSEGLRNRFASSLAYETLFMELASNENALLEFIRGVFPKDVVVEIDQAQLQEATKQKLTQVPQPAPEPQPEPQPDPAPAPSPPANFPTR